MRATRRATRRTVAAALSALACLSALPLLAGPAEAAAFRTVYVMSDNLGDHGFNDNAATGFDRAKAEGAKVRMLQASPSDPQLWRQNLEAVSNQGGYDVIFTGPNMHDNLAAVAPQHPDQKYVFFDDQLAAPNVLSVKYAQNEGSYLAGTLAALAASDTASFPLSKGSRKVAVVAGNDLPVIEDFIAGFRQGAQTAVPGTQVEVIFVGSFNDAQKAYDLTKTAYGNGADVVYNVAGPAGLGILKAAADANRYAIGVDSDQNGLHPKVVLASMVKRIGNSIYDSIKQVQAGKAPFGTLVIYGLKNDGVGLILNDALVPASAKAKLDAARAAVANGSVTVASAFKAN